MRDMNPRVEAALRHGLEQSFHIAMHNLRALRGPEQLAAALDAIQIATNPDVGRVGQVGQLFRAGALLQELSGMLADRPSDHTLLPWEKG